MKYSCRRSGKNHNYEGKFEPWLSYEEEQKFNESANCVINVFNKTKAGTHGPSKGMLPTTAA